MNHLWVGAVGALAPEAWRLVKVRRARKSIDLLYVITLLIYVGVAGAAAWALTQGGSLASAFYTGLSFPLVIDAGTRQLRRVDSGSTGSDIEQIDVSSPGILVRLIDRASWL